MERDHPACYQCLWWYGGALVCNCLPWKSRTNTCTVRSESPCLKTISKCKNASFSLLKVRFPACTSSWILHKGTNKNIACLLTMLLLFFFRKFEHVFHINDRWLCIRKKKSQHFSKHQYIWQSVLLTFFLYFQFHFKQQRWHFKTEYVFFLLLLFFYHIAL